MGNYSDFIRQHTGPKARARRLYWVYGKEEVFKNLVVERVKSLIDLQNYNVVHVSADECPEPEIWSLLNQHPIDTEHKRLIVVTEAQRLNRPDHMINWLKDNQTVRRASATAIFVSSDSEWEDETGVKEVISKSSSAAYVKCSLPKNEEDRIKRAQEVISGWGNIDSISAANLAKRVNFDMTAAYGAMSKANIFPNLKVDADSLPLLAPSVAHRDVVWALVGMRKIEAVEAVQEGNPSPLQVIGALSTHVDMLARLNSVLATANSPRDAASRIGAREQYVRLLYPYAKFYPMPEALRRTSVLTRMDKVAQRGVREGVLESLIALW